eukprot:5488946-Alexandrium_andersonii.AAC.1
MVAAPPCWAGRCRCRLVRRWVRRPRVRLGAGGRRAPGVRRRRGRCHCGAGGRRKGQLGGLGGGD